MPERAVSVPMLLLSGGTTIRIGATISQIAAALGRQAEIGTQWVEPMLGGERLTRFYEHHGATFVLVFEALTKPEHVRRWWGCLGEGYSVPVCEIDLRVGGAWRIVGRTPEGPMPAFYGVYREIDPPRRLVYTECFEPYPDAESVVTTELVADGDGTRMTVTATYPSKEVRDIVLGTGMTTGAAASYEPFIEGWLGKDGEAWGRPVDLEVLPDGSVLISDDHIGAIYRVSYAP